MTHTVASVEAVTVAARGTKYSRANSPKLPPGATWLMVLAKKNWGCVSSI